ncbi:MAG TPA: YbhB/YbcL family Raf kinase inhibitor-like protein [Candidatus Bathyarchaeia archaeon]|nr:YbhB/YbcL family Raf kinase inhibitor-like protein [Candidatus Bathyarchaeia archaeon]
MKIRYLSALIFILIFAAAGAILYFSQIGHTDPKGPSSDINQSSHMKITSPAFTANASIPQKYTCDGKGINPPLAVSDVPADAKSLALIVDDPDAPVPGGFVHWILLNVDPKTSEIGENSVPSEAIPGQNGANQSRYTGPCPPTGTHRYFFKIFALDSPLNLDSSAKREDVERAMSGHILDQAELVGLYKRP